MTATPSSMDREARAGAFAELFTLNQFILTHFPPLWCIVVVVVDDVFCICCCCRLCRKLPATLPFVVSFGEEESDYDYEKCFCEVEIRKREGCRAIAMERAYKIERE